MRIRKCFLYEVSHVCWDQVTFSVANPGVEYGSFANFHRLQFRGDAGVTSGAHGAGGDANFDTEVDCDPTPRPTAMPWIEQLRARYPEIAMLLENPEVRMVFKDLLVIYEQGGQ